jgi:histidine ammonia-lyase
VGEGEAFVDGERMPGFEASPVGLEPIRPAAKEGLSLINGTQFMAAFLALGLMRARRLAKVADLACALSSRRSRARGRRSCRRSMRCGRARADRFRRERVAPAGRVGDQRGAQVVRQGAGRLLAALRAAGCGASRYLLDYVDYTVSSELNSATDNPLVLVEEEQLVSNGNFHGQPLAFALDALAMAVSELASISERRIERLVNPNLSDGLPAFLTTDGGLNSGFMIPQYVAASLVSENKVLCHPASVDSIPTSAGQEDHVSMGNAAGLKAWQVLANCERAVAIELLAGAQAVEFHAPLEPGVGVRATRVAVRGLSPRLRDDRSLAPDIEAVATAIRDGSLVAAAEAEVGELR